MNRFTGKQVLVTGGTQGIGLAIARRFLEEGAQVAITGTRADASKYDADLSGFKYHQVAMENPTDRARLATEVGAIDVLINNAGGGSPGEYELTNFIRTLEVNLIAVMDLCTRFHDGLAARRGAIVNIGSIASFLALKDAPGYTAAKAGVLGLTRSLADKWARDGVRVNMIAPGFIQTRITEPNRNNPAAEKKIFSMLPMHRWGQPEEIAGAALFLASSDASYITGTTITIDGGLTLR